MNDLDKLWIDFNKEWGAQFEKVKLLLDAINDHPSSLHKIVRIEFLKSEDLVTAQKNWLNHIKQFTNDHDKEFFKPYWVPVSSTNLSSFIDLSTDEFSLFESFYFANLFWYKVELVENINWLLNCFLLGEVYLEYIIEKRIDKNHKLVQEYIEKYLNNN